MTSEGGSNACNGADASCCPVCLESEGELLHRGCRLPPTPPATKFGGDVQAAFHGRCSGRRPLATVGEEHPTTLSTVHNLAHMYSLQGKHAKAETLQVAVLAVRKRVLGEEHRGTLTSAHNLARWQWALSCCQLMRIVWSRSCRPCHAKARCPSGHALPLTLNTRVW